MQNEMVAVAAHRDTEHLGITRALSRDFIVNRGIMEDGSKDVWNIKLLSCIMAPTAQH